MGLQISQINGKSTRYQNLLHDSLLLFISINSLAYGLMPILFPTEHFSCLTEKLELPTQFRKNSECNLEKMKKRNDKKYPLPNCLIFKGKVLLTVTCWSKIFLFWHPAVCEFVV